MIGRLAACLFYAPWVGMSFLFLVILLTGQVQNLPLSGYLTSGSVALGILVVFGRSLLLTWRGKIPAWGARTWSLVALDAGIFLMFLMVWPYFSDLPAKSREGATRGQLVEFRVVLRAAAGNGDKVFAGTRFPVRLPRTGHGESVEVRRSVAEVSEDSGRWWFIQDPARPAEWKFRIDCTHTDTRGNPWSAY